jgi:hypothetical protein
VAELPIGLGHVAEQWSRPATADEIAQLEGPKVFELPHSSARARRLP